MSQVNTLYCLVLREKLQQSLLKCRMIWQIVGASWCPLQYKRLPVKLCAFTQFLSNIFARFRRITFKLCKFNNFRRFSPIEWIDIRLRELFKTEKKKVKGLVIYCPRRDFAQKAKSWGGTRVTRAYIKTYSWSIQSVCQKQSRFAQNRGREKSVYNDDVSIVCARKYEMVKMM